MNQNLLQNITHRFANLAMTVRVDCHAEEAWQKPGINILVCVDGGRFRERRTKRGKRKNCQKRQGFHSDWVEPRLLSISQFDENGKKIKTINPILDGSCGNMDDFFNLLKQHLIQINLNEVSQIIFCADNGPGIAADVLPNLFQAFFTTRPQGTGLGLTVVHAVVAAHDGEVSVESLESGSVFTIRLPAANDTCEDSENE